MNSRQDQNTRVLALALGLAEDNAAVQPGDGRLLQRDAVHGGGGGNVVEDVFGPRNTWGQYLLCRGSIHGMSCGAVPDTLAATQRDFASYVDVASAAMASSAATRENLAQQQHLQSRGASVDCACERAMYGTSFAEYAMPYDQRSVAAVTGVSLPPADGRSWLSSHGGAMLGTSASA